MAGMGEGWVGVCKGKDKACLALSLEESKAWSLQAMKNVGEKRREKKAEGEGPIKREKRVAAETERGGGELWN